MPGVSSSSTPEDDARPGEYFFLLGASAFEHKDYMHAVEMYKVAASWAYKPAEYNLGIMDALGQGVLADPPRAMAWMALAAERNDKRYIDARELVYAQLAKEQFDQANMIWRELKKTYGDEVALRRAKARWAEVRLPRPAKFSWAAMQWMDRSPIDNCAKAKTPTTRSSSVNR